MWAAAGALLLFSLVPLSRAADEIIQVPYALYIVIGILAFNCILIGLCCFFIMVVCRINSNGKRGRSSDYLRRREFGDPKKQDLSDPYTPGEALAHGPNSLPIYPSPPTSCTILDPESPSLSAPTSTSDTEPLLDTLVGKKEAGVRERGHKHQRKVHRPAPPLPTHSESVEMKCYTKEYPNINFYSTMMTPGGRRVDEGVSNPAYEEELVPTTLQLSSELNGISDKWFEIGLRLNVPSSILNTIRRVNADDKEVCLMKMCDEWLQREVDPSWSDVVEALESRFVTEQRVADVIQMRYCEPSLDEEPITTAPWSHFNYQ